jgi:hypothetical protein
MTSSIVRPAFVVLALIGAAAPIAAQSANRSVPGAPAARAGATRLANESEQVTRCRTHCYAAAATGTHTSLPHQSVAERQAREAACYRNMAK